MIRFVIIVILTFTFGFSQTKVFYEDCEDTGFSTWFLERSMGTDSYWSILTASITRSEDEYAGTYSMTYDPFTCGNPHSNVGVLTDHGNTSEFDISDEVTSEYYFRWQHKWEEDIDWLPELNIKNKLLYLGYGEWGGDFVFTLEHNDNPSRFNYTVRSNPGYTVQSGGGANSPVSTEDNQWHQMEVYINLGTTGATGTLWVKIDGQYLYNFTNVYFRDQININGGSALNIIQWPSNISGTTSGTAIQWLDNLEIWVDGVPGAIDTQAPIIIDSYSQSGADSANCSISTSSDTDSLWVVFGTASSDTSSIDISQAGSAAIDTTVLASGSGTFYMWTKAEDDSSNVTWFGDNVTSFTRSGGGAGAVIDTLIITKE